MAELSAEQRAALARRVAARRAAERAAPISARAPGTPVPLSGRQRSLWLVESLAPGTVAYNHIIGFEITGALDPDTFVTAFGDVVRRHEALRSRVRVDDDGRPWTVVDGPGERALDVTIVEATQDDITDLLRTHTLRPFDLEHDHPVRLLVARRRADAWTVGVLGHHIALDNRSAAVLVEELFEHYRALRSGSDTPLEIAPLQYGDVVVWEEQMRDDLETRRQQDWWRAHLSGVSHELALPTDGPRPPTQQHQGARAGLDLDTDSTTRLRSAARLAGVTEYVWLLASFAATLARWTGQRSFAIGTPFAGRDRTELADVVGFLNNTLVVPVRLAVDTTWTGFLEQLRHDVIAAFEHSSLSIQEVVEAVAPPRDRSRNPLFQVNFRVAVPPAPEFDCADLVVRRINLDLAYSKFDLAFEVHSLADTLGGHVEYDTALFGPATVEAVIDAWRSVIATVLADPSTPVLALPRPEPRSVGNAGNRRGVRRRL